MSIRQLLVLVAALVAGCAEADPYRREGMWQPEGANQANIAAMVQRPADLRHGRSDSIRETRRAVDAVERLWSDRERPFPGRATSTSVWPATGADAGGGSSKAGG